MKLKSIELKPIFAVDGNLFITIHRAQASLIRGKLSRKTGKYVLIPIENKNKLKDMVFTLN